MYKKRYRITKLLYKFRNKKTLFLAAVFIISISIFLIDKFNINWNKNILVTIFLNIIAGMVSFAFSYIIYSFGKNLEDGLKVSENYSELTKLYKNDSLYCYNQIGKNTFILFLAKLHTDYDSLCIYNYNVTLPVIKLFDINGNSNIQYNFTKTMYQLPDFIENNFNELYSIHRSSNKYNNYLYRLDSYEITGNNNIILDFSYTQYIYSLVTNRSMDTKLKSGLSLRDFYINNNSIGKLNNSAFSNHIGFNAVVVTSDGFVVFIKRNNKVSIEKDLLGLGAQGSIKYKYVSSKDSLKEGIYYAIEKEISDELGINENNMVCCELMSFYRNLVEGGKPQIAVYSKLNISLDKVIELFYKKTNADKSNPFLERDGDELYAINYKDFSEGNVCMLPDGISGIFVKTQKWLSKRIKLSKKARWFYMVPSGIVTLMIWEKKYI